MLRNWFIAPALVALVGAVSLSTAGCDEKLSDITGPTPSLEPTFSSIVNDIFGSPDSAGRVACISCHRAPALPAGLDLGPQTAYDALVGRGSRQKPGEILVIPGDPDNSYLVQKLEGAPGIVGLRMPRNGPPYLTEGQMLVIRFWIQSGAPNN
jgi:hypothetical protein